MLLRLSRCCSLPVRRMASSTKTPRPLPPVSDQAQLKMREDFYRKEQEWEAKVDLNQLMESEKLIHRRHKEAIQGLHLSYEDPFSGLKVMTRWRHYSKGGCCGKACRHCVYQHQKVPEERKAQRRFNSAFWVDIDEGAKSD